MNGMLFPKDEGIGIGSSISPIIANMVLDGLQDEIYRILQPEAFDPETPEEQRSKLDASLGYMAARWCDDFVVIVATREQAQRVWDGLQFYLEDRGLGLSPEKTRIVNIRKGFDFLSRHFVKRRGRVFVYPSEASVNKAITELSEIIDNHSGSQESLIQKVNEKTTGFCTYHKNEQAMDAFRRIDTYIQAKLLEMERRRHPKRTDETLIERYWYLDYYGRHHFATPDKRAVVRLLSETLLLSHQPVNVYKNYYIDRDYFELRRHERSIQSVVGTYRAIWERQEGKCYYCGHRILADEEKSLAVVDATSRRKMDQCAYVHSRCEPYAPETMLVDTMPVSDTQVMDLLESLLTGRRKTDSRYLPLSVLFSSSDKLSISLTFSELEEIIGYKLGKAAKHDTWWYRTGHETISHCWLNNGYEIQKLDMEKQRVSFRRTERARLYLRVPKIYFTNKMPEEMRVQAELLLISLAKRFGY